MAPVIGTKIGQLVLKRQLGEGGMGAVLYAEHQILDTSRAIKVLLPQWTQDSTMVQRFVNEARAAASIKHRNIIGVHDCGQLDDGSWYIVMDYLEGCTLGGFGASRGSPFSPQLALQILAPTANGLEAAHRAGIVHRDLKPDNIFLIQHDHGRNPHHPVILDFGIAKLGERGGGALTRTGMMAGTPAYMAPEQMRNLKVVDPRTDVYALGVIAYQMITGGYLPYQDEATAAEFNELTPAEIFHRQMSRPPIDPRERHAGVPERWGAAIRAALDVDPARRPQSARAFALLLAQATEGDEFTLDGTAIVRAYANELLEIGNLLETVRAPKPATKTPAGARSRYQLGEQLGAGGMAEVYAGTAIGAEGFARPVAIKRVLPGFSTMPQFASMFIDEARLASKLRHENIVSVLDFDRDADDRLFLVMEYIEGRDLAGLTATGRLPFSVTTFVVSAILRGLGYAHELPLAGPVRGLVHRDVSPQNVLLSWEGGVKVSDFGIAKARAASAATASTLIKGKVAYMSPEQANGEALDGRSDLFAVGVILWELLTGTALFQGTSRETVAQLMFGEVPRPSSIAPDVPRDLEMVAMRLLAKVASERYANAELAVDALSRCADAPRNGPSALARLLVERFPERAAARSARPQPDVSPAGTVVAPKAEPVASPRGAGPTPWTPEKTTLATAASQLSADPRARSRWRWALGIAIGAATLTGGTLLMLLGTGAARTPRAAPPEEATLDRGHGSDAARDINVQHALLTVVSDPIGALVSVDSKSIGTSPVTIEVELGRKFTVEVELAGFERSTQVVLVEHLRQTLSLSMVRAASPRGGALAPQPGPQNRSERAQPRSPERSKGSRHRSFDPNDVLGE